MAAHATLTLLPTGSPQELTGELTRVGRGRHCEFSVQSATLGREHSLILRRASGFFLCDLRSSGGTWLSRRLREPFRIGSAVVALEDGDLIGLQCRLRFSASKEAPEASRLAAAVAAEPEDPAHWEAYGAFLRASGDPRHLRIAHRWSAFAWPGSALQSPDLQLDLEWAHGHVRRAALREVRHSGFQLLETLRALLWAPATEFMTELSLSLLPGLARSQQGTAAHHILESARSALEASALPALRRLELSEELGAIPPRLAGSPLLSP